MGTWSVVVVASPLHDAATVAELVAGVLPGARAAGGDVQPRAAVAPADQPLAVLVATGGTERVVLDLWWSRREAAPGEPILLLAHPGHNSLPAALEALARVHQEGGRGRIVMLDSAEPSPPAALTDAVADVAVWHRLRRTRIGLVGEPSDWLVASSPSAEVVRRTWGPTVVPLEIADTLAATDQAPGDAGAGLAEEVATGAVALLEPHRHDVVAAARLEPALLELVAAERLDAVAVRCFDLLSSLHTSGCVALSALNDAGVVAGCEGDVDATLALLWVQLLLGRTGWMANPVHADPDSGRVRLAHCTVPRSLVEGYELRTHFESGIGVGIAGDLPAGPVTLLRVGGRQLDRLWVAEGDALPTHRLEGLCRTQLEVELQPAAVAELLDRPLGNHVTLVYGHHGRRLTGWWRTMVSVDPAG